MRKYSSGSLRRTNAAPRSSNQSTRRVSRNRSRLEPLQIRSTHSNHGRILTKQRKDISIKRKAQAGVKHYSQTLGIVRQRNDCVPQDSLGGTFDAGAGGGDKRTRHWSSDTALLTIRKSCFAASKQARLERPNLSLRRRRRSHGRCYR